MPFQFFRRGLLFVTLLIGFGCSNAVQLKNIDALGGGGDQGITNAKPGPGNIIVLGDSLAEGTGATEPTIQPVGCLTGYFGQVVNRFSAVGANTDQILLQVQNLGTSGLKPKLIFISAGGNDALAEAQKSGSFTEDQTLKNMEQIFSLLLKTGAVVSYLGLNPPGNGVERLPKISQLAKNKGVLVIDGMKDMWLDASKMSSDGIHPNNNGYRQMCNTMTSSMAQYYP